MLLLHLRALQAGHRRRCQGKRPGFTDMVGRAKYDAWAGLHGTSAEAAMQAYVHLVAKLKG